METACVAFLFCFSSTALCLASLPQTPLETSQPEGNDRFIPLTLLKTFGHVHKSH